MSLLELSLTVETKAKPNSRRDTRNQGAVTPDRVENREWKFPTAWGKIPYAVGNFPPRFSASKFSVAVGEPSVSRIGASKRMSNQSAEAYKKGNPYSIQADCIDWDLLAKHNPHFLGYLLSCINSHY